MEDSQRNEAARRLFHAERERRQIGLLSETYPAIDMADAYAIQEEFVRLKHDDGDRRIGWKIGLTSKAMQAALSIDIPDSGVLLQSMAFPNGASISRDRFIQPRIEVELAFVMKSSVSGDATSEEILSATDYVVPALEILDTRIERKSATTGKTRTVFDTIADNAANAGIIVGKPIRDFTAHDLKWIGAILSRNGEVEETGLAAGVLGDPLVSFVWLVRRLASIGAAITPGELVLTGSFVRPIEAPPGSHIVGDFGPFGEVSCTF